MWLVDTFDDFEQYLQMFRGAKTLGEFKSLTFKKKLEPLSIYYGLFDKDDLVAYYWLVKFSSQHPMLHGFELRVKEEYQRRGIAMFFYKHIILNELKIIISDYSHNKTSGTIWEKLSNDPRMKVGSYNRITDQIKWGALEQEIVYGNGHMHFVVAAK